MFWNTFDAIIQASSVIYLTESMRKETLVKHLVNDWNIPVLDCLHLQNLICSSRKVLNKIKTETFHWIPQ